MSEQKWEAYANVSQKESLSIFKEILENKKSSYKVTEAPPIFMYDQENKQIVVKTSEFVISLIYVSADPLTRLFTSLLGTASNFNGVTFLSIQYQKQSREELAVVLRQFTYHCSGEPWNILAYPRFRFAVLLQLITKVKWKRFLSA